MKKIKKPKEEGDNKSVVFNSCEFNTFSSQREQTLQIAAQAVSDLISLLKCPSTFIIDLGKADKNDK